MPERRPTSTSNFGVGRREAHDASAFYDRFRAPELSRDDTVLPPKPVEQPFVCGDARSMATVDDGSVALVVTSPPYFAGKQYEQELAREGVPSSYLEYLGLLADVFAECVRKLEPGGRIAVNVANLGRKPYRSLAADVIRILGDDLGLLLRGELVWQKAEGAAGSCAWGSFRSAANPVLRDITERVVIASKGRFDRARTVKQRAAEGLPFENTVMADDFMALTLDLWTLPPESARRVGHPAPFPVELPEQLIRLYTYRDDLVLDPFMGSGSALVAAARLGRRYVGYDLDPAYVALAESRVHDALADADATGASGDGDPARDAAVDDGLSAARLAETCLSGAGFTVTQRNRLVPRSGVRIDFVATDQAGASWHFDLGGAFTTYRGGLQRSEVLWRAIGQAAAVRGAAPGSPVVLLTTNPPRRGADGDLALRAVGPSTVFDVIDMLSDTDRDRLAAYAVSGPSAGPRAGFWSPAELERALFTL
jgi:site-specific DNA-methyltransferase (adenine-specific)